MKRDSLFCFGLKKAKSIVKITNLKLITPKKSKSLFHKEQIAPVTLYQRQHSLLSLFLKKWQERRSKEQRAKERKSKRAKERKSNKSERAKSERAKERKSKRAKERKRKPNSQPYAAMPFFGTNPEDKTTIGTHVYTFILAIKKDDELRLLRYQP